MSQENQAPSDLVGMAEFAELADRSVASMWVYRRYGQLPPPGAGGGMGNKLLWRRHVVDAWLAVNRPPIPD